MAQYFPFQASTLPYSYVALMPRCDANTLYYHHDDYYVNAVYELNRLVVRHRLTHMSLTDLILQDFNLPAVQLRRIKNAAGTIYNHQLYFDGISCNSGQPPFNRLTEAISATYGSVPAFRQLLLEAAEGMIGSGWIWLVSEGRQGIHISTTENNEVVDLNSVTPILVMDLWEHAYFTTDHFDKAAYVDTWFSLIDWTAADQRYLTALGQGTKN